jgi:hypothetical protein
MNNPVNKWANELNRQFSKEEVQTVNKCLKKKSSTSQNYIVSPSHHGQMAVIKKTNNNK